MPPKRMRQEKEKRPEPNPLLLAGMGFELAGIVVGMTLGGWWLDGKFSTGPWLMLIGLGIGLFGGIYKLWKAGQVYFES